MCTTCGCGEGETRVNGQPHDHTHEHGHDHSHEYSHEHSHENSHEHGHAWRPARSHAAGVSASRMVSIEQDILAKNDAYARSNRQYLAERGIFALNLVSSPGSGKTTLLVKTIGELKQELAIAVIEGDQQTSNDADRIRATGVPAVQINTGKGCHLDAHMVGHAFAQLKLVERSLLFIENVGNLVCPAAFDLGEAHKVAILSVTEGEDKPLKYPDMFHAADVMVLNKIDLLPYLSFDVAQAVAYAKRVNPEIQVFQVSATTGAGMADWLNFLRQGIAKAGEARQETVDSLKHRIAYLENKLATARIYR